MNIRLLFLAGLLLLFASTPSHAQVKFVDPGSDDNRIRVTVRNPDPAASIDHIAVKVLERPDWVTSISVQYASDAPLGPGESRVYTIHFSVAAEVPDGAGSQLHLDISSRSDVLLDAPGIRVPLQVRRKKAIPSQDGATTAARSEAESPTDQDTGVEAAQPVASSASAESTSDTGVDRDEKKSGATESSTARTESSAASELVETVDAPGESSVPAGVPDVVGMDIREAHGIISAAGLTPALEVGPDAPSAEQVNTVARQSVAPDGEIILVIYGEVSIPGRKVPALVGLPFVQAEDLLAERDLFADVEIDQEPDYPEQASTVYRQYPEPGLEVPHGTGIRLWVYESPSESVASTTDAGTGASRSKSTGGTTSSGQTKSSSVKKADTKKEKTRSRGVASIDIPILCSSVLGTWVSSLPDTGIELQPNSLARVYSGDTIVNAEWSCTESPEETKIQASIDKKPGAPAYAVFLSGELKICETKDGKNCLTRGSITPKQERSKPKIQPTPKTKPFQKTPEQPKACRANARFGAKQSTSMMEVCNPNPPVGYGSGCATLRCVTDLELAEHLRKHPEYTKNEHIRQCTTIRCHKTWTSTGLPDDGACAFCPEPLRYSKKDRCCVE